MKQELSKGKLVIIVAIKEENLAEDQANNLRGEIHEKKFGC